MRRIALRLFGISLGLLPLVFVARVGTGLFTNGGFESGDFTGWTKTAFLNDQGLSGSQPFGGISITRSPGGSDQTVAVTASLPETGVDPVLGIGASLKFPKFDLYSARVSGPVAGYNSNSLKQQTTITSGDVDPFDSQVHVRFTYAPVLENPGHPDNQQPYFYVGLRNVTRGNALIYEALNFSNQPGVPWKSSPISFGVLYTDWQIVDIAPGASLIAVGDTIEIELIGAGCSQSGHYGYVYADAFGSTIPGLAISKTASPSYLTPNQAQNLTYTFTYRNTGSIGVSDVILKETIPSGTTFVSVSDPHCTFDNGGIGSRPAGTTAAGELTCSYGLLGPGGSGTFTMVVAVPPMASGSVNNGNYTIQADGIPPTLGPLVITPVGAPADLAITKSASVTQARPGQAFTFNFVVTNNGGNTASNVVVSEQLPSQVTFQSSSSCTNASGNVTCSLGSIAAGAQATFGITVVVNNGVTGSITNANYSVSATGVPTVAGDPVTVPVQGAAPNFGLLVSPRSLSVARGGQGQLFVSYVGFSGFTGQVAVTAPQVPGLTFSPDTFNLQSGQVQTVVVTADAGAASGTQAATFTGTGRSQGGTITRTGTADVTILGPPDFSLSFSPPALSVRAGSSGTASVSVTGLNGFTSDVTVNAPTLAGVTFTPSTFTLTPSAAIVSPGGPGDGASGAAASARSSNAAASQVVTVAIAAGTAAAGPVDAVFTGTAAGVSGGRTAKLALTITPGPDFTLTVTPASLSVELGQSGQVSVSAAGLNGFTGNVSVSAPAAITGVSFTPATFTVAAGSSQTVAIAAASSAQVGSYNDGFTGTASGVSGSRSGAFTLKLTAPPQQPPVITNFSANPGSIDPGRKSTLSWRSTGGTSATIDNGIGSVPTTGTHEVSPRVDTTYHLTVTGPGGSASATASVTILACNPPNPPEVPRIDPEGNPGGPVTATDVLVLSWAPPVGGPAPDRYEYRINGEPMTSTTDITAEAPARGTIAPIQLFVRAFACTPQQGGNEAESPVYAMEPPGADFLAPASVQPNQEFTLTEKCDPPATSWLWLFDDGTPPAATPSVAKKYAATGTRSVTLVATNGSGSSLKTRTISVTNAAPPAPTSLTARRLDETETGRYRGDVCLGGDRTHVLSLLPLDSDAVVYLRFHDRSGRLVAERRLVVAASAGEALFQLEAYGLAGDHTMEVVSTGRLVATVIEQGR